MSMKKIKSTFIIVFLTFLANAHEFWLQPAKFRFALGDTIKLDFMVGESFTGEYWDLKKHKAEKMELHRISGVRDLVKEVKPTQGDNITFKADQEGTYLFSLQSNAAYIELEGDKFNDYLKEDGLDYILDERIKSGTFNKKSTEFYSRYAKVLVQTGNKTDDIYKKKLGFRYEVIPNQNPYTLKAGDYLDCRILFDGKPAAHALVKVWNRVGTTTFLQNIYTENDGTMRFPISASGPWMVSSVKMIHSEKTGAEYHSLWASLVFGI
jgi:uncharacterized GH25 family protein